MVEMNVSNETGSRGVCPNDCLSVALVTGRVLLGLAVAKPQGHFPATGGYACINTTVFVINSNHNCMWPTYH